MHIGTVMVVDDCDLSQMIAQLEIQKFDARISIIQAFDGQEALENLASAERQPDVIFLDINMPRMNGLQFLEQYDRLFHDHSVVAMLSSSTLEQDTKTACSYDCVKHYFSKPFGAEHISAVAANDTAFTLSARHG